MPPYDHLNRENIDLIENIYRDALEQLKSRLESLERFPVQEEELDRALSMTVAMLAAGIYSAGCALLNLFNADLGLQMPALFRSQFEAAVKIAYVRSDPNRARDFIDAEPFERYFLTLDHAVSPALMKSIKDDALSVIRQRRKLIGDENDQRAILDGKIDPNYTKIRNKLKFKSVEEMLRVLHRTDPRWSADLYTIMFRIGSQPTHNSVLFVRQAFPGFHSDGTARFSIDQHFEGAADYLLQAANYLLGACSNLDDIFGAGSDERAHLVEIVQRHQKLARHLGAVT